MDKAAKLFNKLAVGPYIQQVDDLDGAQAQFIRPEGLDPKANLPKKMREQGLIQEKPDTSRVGRRHELAHWLNWKKGKYPKSGESSLKGIAQRVGDEWSAHQAMWPKTIEGRSVKKNVLNALGTVGSTVNSYKGRFLKSLTKLK